MKKGIIIFSGGMDSTTLLLQIKKQGYEVYGLSFFYGQRHKKELEFAKYWGESLCKIWKLIDISFMQEIADQSSLLNSEIAMPHDHYTDKNQRITVVPNRNMLMLSIAVAWAENLKIDEVFFAPHSNDLAIYPDCRLEFVTALSNATQLATYQHVKILAPYVNIRKADIAKIGHDLGLDYSKTWSCYEGKNLHCGKCGTCQERKEAFALAQIPDPTQYEKD